MIGSFALLLEEILFRSESFLFLSTSRLSRVIIIIIIILLDKILTPVSSGAFYLSPIDSKSFRLTLLSKNVLFQHILIVLLTG